MADKKSPRFRFRLPWLVHPAPAPASEPPRTATQTSVSSTSAQRSPFRPPGRAPVMAAPPMVATPAPASPRRSPPQSVSKSPIAETIEPVATQATKETQTTTETLQTTETEPVKETQTTTETIPTAETPPRKPRSQQPTSPPQTPPQLRVSSHPEPVTPTHISTPPQSVPKSPTAETIEPVATQATKETQTTIETVQTTETEPVEETQTTTETIPTAETPPRQPQLQQSTSPPQSPPQFRVSSLPDPLSPRHIRTPPQTNSQPRSPTRMANRTSPSSSSPEASPPRAAFQPSSPVHGQPSRTHTPPRSPSKTSSSTAIPEIKRSTDITKVKEPQTKSQRPKPITASTRVPLHREMKDDIAKFIHKIATTSTSKQSMNKQQQNVITIAGDNKGALMHLNSDAIKREIKQDSKLSENEEVKAIVNSNIQGINNSMMFNSFITEGNPGVHLVVTQNQLTNMNDSKMKNAESMEMQRAEFNVSPPQKLVYDPMIGRSMQDDFEPDDFETPPNSHEIEVL